MTREREALVEEWLAQVVTTYPERWRRLALAGGDRVHNPVGYTLRHGLASILDAALAGDLVAAAAPIDDVIHLQVAQGLDAEDAVAFVRPLATILENHEVAAAPGLIDQVKAMAADVYSRCRDRLSEIRMNDARRRTWLRDRVTGASAECGPGRVA